MVKWTREKLSNTSEKKFSKEYEPDFEYFSNKHVNLYLKHKNEIVAVKKPSLQQLGPTKKVEYYE